MNDFLISPNIRVLHTEPSITFDRTQDVDYISSVINEPSIYAAIRDDSSPTKIEPGAWLSDHNQFIRVKFNGADAGFLAFLGEHPDIKELHTCLLPDFRGGRALAIVAKVFAWIFKNTGTKIITTFSFEHTPHIRLMARKAGFKQTGRSLWPNTVGGVQRNIIHYALTQEDL